MSSSQKGFAQIFFIIVVLLAVVVIGGWIYWTQKVSKNPTKTKPGQYLQQIADPEKFAEQNSTDTLGKVCGGFAGITCSVGLTCKLDGDYPDATGKCVKE
ncbi:MAG: hypothetical protein WCV81_00620 [Microgenomates group bacterium]|jgi:predicted negative regulator of RcsB-dependent stress response